jgi:hypothetical protein
MLSVAAADILLMAPPVPNFPLTVAAVPVLASDILFSTAALAVSDILPA